MGKAAKSQGAAHKKAAKKGGAVGGGKVSKRPAGNPAAARNKAVAVGGEAEAAAAGPPPRTVGQFTAGIKNKVVRSELYDQLRHEKAKLKKQQRVARRKAEEKAVELGQEPPPRKTPRTIESARERDDTIVAAGDEEVEDDHAEDEFAATLTQGAEPPKVLVTTSRKPSGAMFKFVACMFDVIPNMYYHARKAYEIKTIVEYAKAREFTDVLVFNENKKFSKGAKVNGLLLIHLPDGPTAHFKVSNVVLTEKIKNHGRATPHRPELILNGFTTRLGHRVGRMFSSVFPQNPQFRGRRAVTMHNQRDFIFFRHHRYIFEVRQDGKSLPVPQGHLYDGTARSPPPKKGKRKRGEEGGEGEGKKGGGKDPAVQCRLQELGPRFTLKLQSLQKGTFDSKQGEFEWVRPADKVAAAASRRKFYL